MPEKLGTESRPRARSRQLITIRDTLPSVRTPLISILLPVYDAAGTLGAALASIRRQSEPRFQCVIVDDGSRDESAALAERVAVADDRFLVLRRSHAGLVAALNAGIPACKAPYIARMDADDLMSRERLAHALAALTADPTLAGVGCHVRLFPRRELKPKRLGYESWLNAIRSPEDVQREVFIECPLAHPTLTLRAEVLRAFAYREHGWPEDYDLVLRLLSAGQRLGVVPAREHHWRDSPERYSRTHPSCSLERFVACKAAFLAQGLLASSERYLLWGYGDTGKALSRALRAHGKRPSAIIELHPGRLGQLIDGAPVLPPSALAERRAEPLLVSVAGLEARTLIRGELAALGFRELSDFLVTA
jgi:cellulose synthase/poly-beta-1,6-N-acetylglucosamine synthase-like glycosyltransferase